MQCMQHVGDKALAAVLDNQQFLEAIVEPLSGVTTASAAAGDDITREALAEAVLILVSMARVCTHQPHLTHASLAAHFARRHQL